MMIYQEKDRAAACAAHAEEEMKLILESIVSEDRWVRNFIERLAGVTPDVKHWEVHACWPVPAPSPLI
jgi:hypothetical protein